MANEYEVSAGISPIDNSAGATSQSYYVSAGLIPDDTAVVGVVSQIMMSSDAFHSICYPA